MKKLFAVPLAVFFVAACSDSTAPARTADLDPSYAKPAPPPAGGCGTSCAFEDIYTFEGVATASGGTSVGTDVQDGFSGASAATVIEAPNHYTHFIGRFENTRTTVTMNIPAGYATYDLAFDFYTIGSWDGRGKQAQQGIFKANVFDLSYRCGTDTPVSLFTTSFSNQATVQQDYPNSYLKGGFKAATDSYGVDLLGYREDPSSNTPLFRSYGDVEYTIRSAGTNPCNGAAVQFIVSTSNPTQQSVYDESWGVDNIHIKAGN